MRTYVHGGGYSPYYTEKGGKALDTCSPLILPKGGQRWRKGVNPYGC